MTRRFQLSSLCVFVLLLAVTYSVAQAPPSADVLSYSPTPNQNYGTYSSLFVQKESGVISASYVKFNITTLPAGAAVSKATLRLFVNQVSGSGKFDVYQLNGSWTEGGLTYNNAPALGTSATGNNPVSFSGSSVNQFIVIDITSLVQAWANGSLSNNGLALAITTTSGGVAFDSKEAITTSHQPELEIALNGAQGPPGPQGPQGPAGAAGPEGPAGPQGVAGANGQGFTFRNAFNNGTNYNAYDVVTYNGSTYNAKVTIPAGGGIPDQNPNWALWAQVGAQGQQGQQGAQGATGATGPQGPQGLPGNLNPGSPYYVQNGSSQQTGTSFNIDGTGTVGGTLAANLVNSTTNYEIGGLPVLSTSGQQNLFAGAAGRGGTANTLLGNSAGQNVANGTGNVAVGNFAGNGLLTGNNNTIVGNGAGQNVGANSSNTYIGWNAGVATQGDNNTFIGSSSGQNVRANSSDLYIVSPGLSGENNTIRIGTDGTSSGQQNTIYVAGINEQSITAGNAVWINANGMLGIGPSSSGGVSSFNTRTGAVVPAANDYSFSLLSGTLADGQLSGSYSSPLTLANASNIIDGTFAGNGAGLTNVPVSAGSSNYIQNGTSQQTGSNFNISGNGVAAGSLTGTTAVNTTGTYQINGSTILSVPNDGNVNLFLGSATGTSGDHNLFAGSGAGVANTTGNYNLFLGLHAGEANTTGTENVYIGPYTGADIAAGTQNTFVGVFAGDHGTSGTQNTFLGYDAGQPISGSNNIVIGVNSGTNSASASSDIYIGNQGVLAAENNTIRIGTQGTGTGQQNTTYVAGISGTNVSGGINVVVNSNGQLGVAGSSRRFKDNILDMADASSKLFQLRPVTFFYKPQYDDGSHILQYGLIAEEVAKIYPGLVVYGQDGQPQTVRYHLLTPMLLNELQKQHQLAAEQQTVIAGQEQQIQTQHQQIELLQKQNEQIQQQNEQIQQRLLRLESLLSK